MKRALAVALPLLGFTLSSVFVYPGRTYLQSDTQIYIPIFEHLLNPAAIQGDLLLQGVHLRYTIYDEVTLALRRISALDFEWVLLGQQILFRYLGAWGAYLLARACGLGALASVLVSGGLWLGAFVYGPAIITTEYEPVPRGFAVPLTVLSVGLLARGAPALWAGVPLGIAFLYHAPAIWPVLLIAAVLRQGRFLAATATSALLLAGLSIFQPGPAGAQSFFSILDTPHAHIQQLRAPYNWLYRWLPRYFWTFAITGPLALAAAWRLRGVLPPLVRPYALWLPIVGFATIPASLLLQERLGWALLPQIQPMRALLYCHLLCQWLGLICAALELREGRWLRGAAWLLVPLSLALRGDFLQFTPADWTAQAALALAVIALAWLSQQRWAAYALPLLLAVPWAMATYGHGAAPSLESPDLRALSAWAKQQGPGTAMYFFPDLGRKPEPGVFRARSLQPVYACWKQGGQVNYFAAYAYAWHERWTQLLAPGHAAMDYADLRRRGITRLILTQDAPHEPLPLLYTSPGGRYRVYALR
ncbi:MAG: hypothetical protein OHK0021_08390 [Bryobacter sp.]